METRSGGSAISRRQQKTRAPRGRRAAASRREPGAGTALELAKFLSAAAHDLRDHLLLMSLNTQILQRKLGDGLDAEGRHLIESAMQAARQMDALLHDIMTYAGIARPVERSPQPVDSGAIVRDILQEMKEEIARAGATVQVEDLPVVRANRVHLVLLFRSLISNTLKFRGAASPVVRISARRSGRWWRFSVTDNGIGIDPLYADQVFEAFNRLHGDAYPGTGMGLAIARKVVRAHGGEIHLTSRPDEGATFSFTLPAAPAARAAAQRAARPGR